MKKTLLLSILVLSLTAARAFALDAGSSWGDIKENSDYLPLFTDVSFPGASISVDGVCLESDGVTLNGGYVDVCLEWKQGPRNANGFSPSVCAKTESQLQETSINYTYQSCTQRQHRANGTNPCVAWETLPAKYSLDYDVDVLQRIRTNGRLTFGYPAAFSKPFSIPACAK